MSIKEKAKTKLKNQAKKMLFKIIKPFLPFIIIIVVLFLAVCTIIDAIFIQEVQSDSSLMSEEQQELRTMCIEKAEYLNTCHNYIGNNSTQYLLDIDNREIDKAIQWSHLYSLMVFHNTTSGEELNKELLNKVASKFESTFIYEIMIIKEEILTEDENGNQNISIKEQTSYILIESDTIMGHYKYHYEENTTQKNNTKITKKVFVSEELIGEKNERLKRYLKDELHIRENDIETDVEIIMQAASGYYEGKENTSWLQGNSSSSTIITDGKGLVPTRNVHMASTRIYKNHFPFWYENSSNYSVYISYILVQIYGAPMRNKFCCNG